MIFITTYRIKQLSKDETKELMGVFADKGVPSTVKAHYVAADGSHGVVIAEADDLEEAYRNILNYAEWIEYDTKPYLTIEQAVPHIMDYICLCSSPVGLSAGGGRAGHGRTAGLLLPARWRLKQEPDPRGRCGDQAELVLRAYWPG